MNSFMNLIESSVDGIIAADMKGNIFIFNKGAEALTGYTAEEVIGKLHITKIYPEGVAKEIMKKLRSPEYGGVGKFTPTQLNVVNKFGEEIHVQLSAALIYDGKGAGNRQCRYLYRFEIPSHDGEETSGDPPSTGQFREDGFSWKAGRRHCP